MVATPQTLGELRQQVGARPRSVKQEIRDNLVRKLQSGEPLFPGVIGYDETVIPQLVNAILSRHNFILLGLRGQAKSRILRALVDLLDEQIAIIPGCEIHDDPLNPICSACRSRVAGEGDRLPIAWLPRAARYVEKLATPDVSIADLIGDVDPIKAASLKLPYSDERVIHFGLIPRSHRCIFVINELPDLQARIQVALFNILQEGDIQIRGFKLRLLLDLQFVFTANPEDYTNRGSIVTPLKDRIDSQIITHYPKSIEIGKKITEQEARIKSEQKRSVSLLEIAKDLVEQIAVEARKSEYVDAKSGVSARLTISAYEALTAAAERRTIINQEKHTTIRITDFVGVIPAITGKVELVYEGEQEGPAIVAQNLVGKALRTQFVNYFPDPEKFRKQKEKSPYKKITAWFGDGHTLDLLGDLTNLEYEKNLRSVPGLLELVNEFQKQQEPTTKLFLMEFALHGLAEYSLISKHYLASGLQFKDLISGMFSVPKEGDEDLDDDEAFGNRMN